MGAVFDMAVLLSSTCDDRELAAQVAGVFLVDIPTQIAALAAALDAEDVPTAERTAHTIKGASATVGGNALRDVALECELAGKAGDLPAMRQQISGIREQYALLEAELRANGFAEES